MRSLSIILLLACSAIALSEASNKVIVCYFGSWSVYRPGAGKFDVENIDPRLCTHAIYSFAGLKNNKIVATDPWNDLTDNGGKGAYLRFTKLNKKNKHLVPMLAIGGWSEGSKDFSEMVSSGGNRKTFVKSVVEFLNKYHFKGLDIDWEYPTQRGGRKSDKENFIQLLKELRGEFNKRKWILTAAVAAGIEINNEAYDVKGMSKYLDHIHVMTYDFHGGDFESFTGINAPLHPRKGDTKDQQAQTIERSIQYWLKRGAPKNKLVLGLPLYGHTYILKNNKKAGIYAPSKGVGKAFPFTGEAGTIGFNEVCLQKGYKVNRDQLYASPFMYKGNSWISYDDPQSIAQKVQYLNKMGLKGAMVWSIDTDDFRGKCGKGKFPLMNAIKKNLK